ncbi:hypothetical protein ACS0X5_21330 [Burkholderia gladioli]|uniref:hypothetical protein n=1 Tax=Burkholderia gladioli TaxID=28095 RepID=UPI003F7A1013
MVPIRSDVPSARATDISATDKVPPTTARRETCANHPEKRRIAIPSSVMNERRMLA